MAAWHQWFSLGLSLPVIPFCSVWYLFSTSHLSLSQPVLNLCAVLTVEKESKPKCILQLDVDSLIFFTILCVTYFQTYQRYCFFALGTLSASSCRKGHCVLCRVEEMGSSLPLCSRGSFDLIR